MTPEIRKQFEIITMDERLAMDNRGLSRLTALSNGTFIVRKAMEQPPMAEPIDPQGMAEDLLEQARKSVEETTRGE